MAVGSSGMERNMGEWTREALRQRICQASFAMDDVLLYLDTHPEDQEALSYYHYVTGLRNEAVDAWQRQYGPLMVDAVQSRTAGHG